jgi:manganese/zinc/iron transport system permease protein
MMGWFEWWGDYTLRTIALGSALLGLVGGLLGVFAMWRRQSLMGDVLAHAALPGIVLAFMLTGQRSLVVVLLGAAVAAWLGSLLLVVLRQTRLPPDAAQGVVLGGFFGVGSLLLTFVQQGSNAQQAGLDRFLFGQAATLVTTDLWLFGLLAGVALLSVALLYKEFKLLCFDAQFLSSLGFPATRLGLGLTGLLVLAVLIGLQTVGVVLMASLLVAPAAAARQWTQRLGSMVVLAGVFGAVSGVGGALLSAQAEHLPTGPLVVLIASGLMILSLLLAPARGWLWEVWPRRTGRRSS